MKTNATFVQSCIINETMREYNNRDLAEAVVDSMQGCVELAVYEVHGDAIVFRKKKDVDISDSDIFTAFIEAYNKLIIDSPDVIDRLSDSVDLDYHSNMLTESFMGKILDVRRNGRLLTIEIDLL